MADVKDILGVSRFVPKSKSEAKKEKEKVQRPAGMSREAFALLDGSHPIVPSLADEMRKKNELQGLKEKRKDHKVTWRWQQFVNEGRVDGLQLSHWVKSFLDASGKARPTHQGEYQFAKYNRRLLVHRYSDEEWDNVIAKDPAWSREETDYLLDLCETFQLRFFVVSDRYQFPGATEERSDRSMEDLKARYYSIARQLMIAREGNQEDIENRTLIKSPFDAEHEKQRKQAAEMMMQRTPQQEAEENGILEQAKALEATRKAEELAQRAAASTGAESPTAAAAEVEASMLEFHQPLPQGMPSLVGPDLQPMKPAVPGVYCRRAHTREQANAQLAAVSGGARMVKTVEATYADLHVAEPPQIGTRAVCATWLALRTEIIEMLELKNKLTTVQRATGSAAFSSDPRKKVAKGKGSRVDDVSDMPSSKRPRTTKKYADD